MCFYFEKTLIIIDPSTETTIASVQTIAKTTIISFFILLNCYLGFRLFGIIQFDVTLFL
jgi:hypothetical protein